MLTAATNAKKKFPKRVTKLHVTLWSALRFIVLTGRSAQHGDLNKKVLCVLQRLGGPWRGLGGAEQGEEVP